MQTNSRWCKRLTACAKPVLIVVAVLPVALAILGCGGDSSRYTPPPATIIRALDTVTPSPTPTGETPSPTLPQQAPTLSPTEDYPVPVVTPSSPRTPEAYPGK